jgi:hypothetical protein
MKRRTMKVNKIPFLYNSINKKKYILVLICSPELLRCS